MVQHGTSRHPNLNAAMARTRFIPSPAALRLALIVALPFAAACASGGSGPASSDPSGGVSRIPSQQPAMAASAWQVRTKEHVDLWLHSYALITRDTTLVPYFRRGYRDRMLAVRRQRNATSLLDTDREKLLARIAANPSLATNGQFLPLYFTSWDQMRQAIDLFQRANGNPNATQDAGARQMLGLLASTFPSAADRQWLATFSAAVDDESRKFYHVYWTAEASSHAATVTRTDALWQGTWRPALQRFLNNTQQQNGELYLTLPLGGEGRTVHFGKQENAVAGAVGDSPAEAEVALYVVVHEITGAVAGAAIEDNTTPADRRAGVTSRYEQAAAVRAGALLLERVIPAAVPGYMRYYLQQAGRAAPSDPRSAFASAYSLPDAVREAITRQFDVVLGGI